MLCHIIKVIVNMANAIRGTHIEAIMPARRYVNAQVFPPCSLPQRASGLPQTISEGISSRLAKLLMWLILSAIGPAIFGIRPISLAALREGARGATAPGPFSRDPTGLPPTRAELAAVD